MLVLQGQLSFPCFYVPLCLGKHHQYGSSVRSVLALGRSIPHLSYILSHFLCQGKAAPMYLLYRHCSPTTECEVKGYVMQEASSTEVPCIYHAGASDMSCVHVWVFVCGAIPLGR